MAKIINAATMNPETLTEDEHHWCYNGLDCSITHEIYTELRSVVDDVCLNTYEFSKALQAPVLEMNLRGLLVNKNRRRKVISEMRRKLTRLEEQLMVILREGVGITGDFNWRSPVQCNKLFYDVMQLPVQKKRKADGRYGPSTDREALEKLSQYFIAEPICAHFLAMRDLGKSIGFLETPIDSDGRFRTNFNIAGTVTGRFSSEMTDFGTGSNLQNVNSALRSVFVADPGMKFANLDLEQADARNVGALAWNALVDHPDWNECTAGMFLDFAESGDLHTNVLKMSSPHLPWGKDGKTDREVADTIAYRHLTHRDLTKKLGHGSNFLGQPPTMARHAKLPVQMVKEFQENYFNAFPCITAWHQSIFWALEHMGQLTTPFGRRRFFFDRPKEASTRREAVAHQPQSMTGDEINTGILKLWRANRVQLLVQVHDSILFQYPEEQEDDILAWAMATLPTTIALAKGREFTVPTDCATGWNWGYYDEHSNSDGLKKWKGSDNRKRQETAFQLSIMDL